MSNEHYEWHGRVDIEDGKHGLRWHQKVENESSREFSHKFNQPTVALCGFCCDLGVEQNKGRVGAKLGPDTIRKALSNLASHNEFTLCDSGNIVADQDMSLTQKLYAKQIESLLKQHNVVIGLGGGHEIAWGSYKGLLSSSSKKRIGIINFDAHFDLRQSSPFASSGTPFRQIAEHCEENNQAFNYACIGVSEASNTLALFDYAHKTNVRYLLDHECDFEKATALLSPMLKEVDELYVTICLDAFPSYLAPGVSAPSSLGIDPRFVIKLINWIAKNQKLLSFKWRLSDIAEMNPTYDIDNSTARLAARLIFEIVNAKSRNI